MPCPPCLVPGQGLNYCAKAKYEQEVEGRFDLSGEWRGWKIRNGRLIGPFGVKFTPAMAIRAAIN